MTVATLASLFVIVLTTVDVDLGRVTVDFPFDILVMVVVSGCILVVVYIVMVSTRVVVCRDPAIVLMDVCVVVLPVCAWVCDIVIVAVMKETPEEMVLVKVCVTVSVAVAIAAEPCPGPAFVTTAVTYATDSESVTVDVATYLVIVKVSMAIDEVFGEMAETRPVRFSFLEDIQLTVLVVLAVAVFVDVLIAVTTMGLPVRVVVRPGWTFFVIVRVVVVG